MYVMEIEIRDNKTIDEIRTEFFVHYPFLKIEFYNASHKLHEKSLPTHLVDHNKTIGEVRKKHRLSTIEIYSWQKTNVVEENFENNSDYMYRYSEDREVGGYR